MADVPKWDDTEEVASSAPKFEDTEPVSFEDTEPVEAPAAPVVESKPTMSRPEAAAVSFGQGTSLGLAPLASGVVGAGMEAAQDVGDALGLTDDAKLQDVALDELPGLSPKLRAKLAGKRDSFQVEDKEQGLSGLLDAYYSSRDAQKRAQDTAFEEYPVQSIVTNIAGSLPTTIATAGLGQAGNAGTAANVASKVLPNANRVKAFAETSGKAKLANSALTGMREGAKAGALTGLGNGDARLLEGEIAETGREVLDSTVGGSLVGGGLPIAGAATKKVVGGVSSLIPGLESIKTAFKGGMAGMDLTEEAANSKIKDFSGDLLTQIQNRFRQAGMDKASALDYADEIGLRVDAGEAFDDVMDDIVSRGAASPDSRKELDGLLNTFKMLKNGPEDKLQNKLDVARAKMTDRMEQKGYELLDDSVSQSHVQDFIPESEAANKIGTAKQTFQKLGQEGDDVFGAQTPTSKPVTKILQASGTPESDIPLNTYDLKNLSLKELEDVLSEVNRHTGDLTGPAKTQAEQKARQLAAQLRSMSEEAFQNAGQGSGNNELHNIFNALRQVGIDDNVLTKNQFRKNNMVDTIQRLTRGADDINQERFYEYLKKADPQKFGMYEESGKFLNDFANIAKQNKPLSSSNTSGLFGSTMNKVNVATNKAGQFTGSAKEFFAAGPQALEAMAQKLGMEGAPKAAQSYITPLMNAAKADERKRAAILYGLYQQPAFREMYQQMGNSLTGNVLDEEEQN